MFNEIAKSLSRYVIMGIVTWLTSTLVDNGFHVDDAESFAKAVGAALGSGFLLFWSYKKNKKNVIVAKEKEKLETEIVNMGTLKGLRNEDFND